MNKKGFTLIELLATIVLLAIIVSIAIPAVSSIIGKNKKNSCTNIKNNIIRAAQLYVSDNKYNLDWVCNEEGCLTTVKYSDLYPVKDTIAHNNAYLNGIIVDPCNNEEYREENAFSLTFKNDNGDIKLVSDFVFPDFPKDSFKCCRE